VKRTLIVAAVLLSTVVSALPASAGSIDTYINGPWLEFKFGQTDSWAGACTDLTCVASLAGNSTYLDAPAWTFNLGSSAELKITDAFFKGDSFNVYDFGTLILEMPPELSLGECGDDPDKCFGTNGVSYDSVSLQAGDHSLTIQVAKTDINTGAAFFRIDRIVGVPEPMSLILLCLGLLGLGAIGRSRN
jgi:hypothetical protein